MEMTQIKIVDTDDGREFIVFSEGDSDEVAALLDSLNYADYLVVGVVE